MYGHGTRSGLLGAKANPGASCPVLIFVAVVMRPKGATAADGLFHLQLLLGPLHRGVTWGAQLGRWPPAGPVHAVCIINGLRPVPPGVTDEARLP